MSTIEAVLPWISSLDLVLEWTPKEADQGPASPRSKVGTCSLRQIVEGAVAHAEGEAIRRALTITLGNKSRAARLLHTTYTTLHAKMKRYRISAREYHGDAGGVGRPRYGHQR